MVIYDSEWVSLDHLLLSWYYSQRGPNPESVCLFLTSEVALDSLGRTCIFSGRDGVFSPVPASDWGRSHSPITVETTLSTLDC